MTYDYSMIRWLIVLAVVVGLLGTLWTASCEFSLGGETATAPCHYTSASPLAAGLVVSLLLGLPMFAALWPAPRALLLAPARLQDQAPQAVHSPPTPPPPRWH
jgi:hypothetical protein